MKKINIILVSIGLALASLNSATAQVKVGTNPTTIATTSNLEVEAANGGKFTVTKDSAKVIIKDGTQGAGRLLTSDADGKASWKTAKEANLAELVLRAYNPNIVQPTGAVYIPNVPIISGDAGNYNASTGVYTVTEPGFYEYNMSLEVVGTLGEIFTIRSSIAIQEGTIRISSATWNPRVISGVRWMEAGEQFVLTLGRISATPFTTDWKVQKVSILIHKR